MNDKLQIFENPEFGQVRVILQENGEPLFCLADVCFILELTPSKVAQRLEDDVLSKYPISDSLGRQQDTNFINEEGLYDVILGSRKESTKPFRKWVTSEVLPSIRKTGSYSVRQKLPQTFAQALRAYADEVEKNEMLKLENTQQKQMIGELQPKAAYYDEILKSKDCLTITQIAKDYGMSGHQLNQFLSEQKIQYKQSKQWLLYSNYHREGYTKSETVSITRKDGCTGSVLHTKWTQRGRLFLYELLKRNNILPLIEQES
jgi:hypothetical protein|nr:MAG TPA: repressor domain protein [Caudoviricetes sp.]